MSKLKWFLLKILYFVSLILPDRIYLILIYFFKTGKLLNLINPKTYNEKIQWLKLYDRNNKYTIMADKYEVKKYVSEIIWEEYTVPTLWIYNTFDDIDFNKLPCKFVIKCTHDSWWVIIIKDKNEINYDELKQKINKFLKRRYYLLRWEWVYKNIKPRIIIEKYMEDKNYHELRDFKFFTFGWKVRLMFIATNRQWKWETYFDFFDEKFNHLKITNWHPMNPNTPEKPKNFDKMIELAEILSNDIPHLRVDFYEINWKIYFWEFTFYHWWGIIPFKPDKWNYTIWNWIILPK